MGIIAKGKNMAAHSLVVWLLTCRGAARKLAARYWLGAIAAAGYRNKLQGYSIMEPDGD